MVAASRSRLVHRRERHGAAGLGVSDRRLEDGLAGQEHFADLHDRREIREG